MAGEPTWFEVSNLEIYDPVSGDPLPIIEISPTVAGDGFRVRATFEGPNNNPPVAPHFSWLGQAEWISDNVGLVTATAEFWAESIGPGTVEASLGTANVNLTAGGDPGGHPGANMSLYQVEIDIANANTKFVDTVPVPEELQPGVYRIACAINLPYAGGFADAYYSDDFLVRVVERP